MSADPAPVAELLLIAAGRGTRMGDLTRLIPKAMVPVERGRSILEVTLANLCAAAGPVPACVVGGHGWVRLQACCAAGNLPVPVRAILNPDYAIAGPACSILVGLATVPVACGSVVVGNGDTLFSTALLARALNAPPGITLFVSHAESVAADELRVMLNGEGLVAEAAKAGEATAGDPGMVSAGLVTACGDAARSALASALATVAAAEREGGRLLPWHAAFRILAAAGTPARAERVGRAEWAEFDTEHCLTRYAAAVPDAYRAVG